MNDVVIFQQARPLFTEAELSKVLLLVEFLQHGFDFRDVNNELINLFRIIGDVARVVAQDVVKREISVFEKNPLEAALIVKECEPSVEIIQRIDVELLNNIKLTSRKR